MNYRIHSLIVALLVLIILPACYGPDYYPCIRPIGQVYEETRSVSDFHSVTISVPADVYIDYAPENSVVIMAAGNILDHLTTSTRGNTLSIDHSRCLRTKTDDITIYLTTPDIRNIHIRGSGNVFISGDFVTEKVSLEISGSGHIHYHGIVAEKVYSNISGSGNINVSGLTDSHMVQISGSGKVNAFDLESVESWVQISGSGSAMVNASHLLDARISGSGKVVYTGNPAVSVRISGSGRVERRKGN